MTLTMTDRTMLVTAVALLALSLSLLALPRPAHASTIFTVNQITDVADANLSDNLCDINSSVAGNQCTLRAAIQEANDTPGADTIQFSSDPKGNEGKKLLGSKSVTTDASGNVGFTFSPRKAVAVGNTTTATATKNSTGDTSEFSAPRKVVKL